jgi:phage FluMu protein Com
MFALSGIDILADNKMMMHGLCIECNSETLRVMDDTIWIRAKCPNCGVELTIMTFEEDPTEPLKSCGECNYSGELTILETMQKTRPK